MVVFQSAGNQCQKKTEVVFIGTQQLDKLHLDYVMYGSAGLFVLSYLGCLGYSIMYIINYY